MCLTVLTSGNPDAKRLFDDLLSSYNKLVRPVMNVTDAVTVKFKLKLSQLIDVVSVLLKYSALDIQGHQENRLFSRDM